MNRNVADVFKLRNIYSDIIWSKPFLIYNNKCNIKHQKRIKNIADVWQGFEYTSEDDKPQGIKFILWKFF